MKLKKGSTVATIVALIFAITLFVAQYIFLFKVDTKEAINIVMLFACLHFFSIRQIFEYKIKTLSWNSDNQKARRLPRFLS